MLKKGTSAFFAVILALAACLSSIGVGGSTVHAAPAAPALGIPGVVHSLLLPGDSDITVDGSLDEAVWRMDGSDGKELLHVNPGDSSNNTVVFDTAWDSTNLYVAVNVFDESVIPNGSDPNNLWSEDTVELFIDGDNKKSSSYDANDYQIFIGNSGAVKVSKQGGGDTSAFAGAIHVATQPADDGRGYSVEVAIPWSAIGVTNPAEGTVIGFDVGNDDSDTVTDPAPQTRITAQGWYNADNTNYLHASTFGNLILAQKNTPVASVKGTPTVDGDLADWAGLPRSVTESAYSGNYNNALTFASSNDKNNLYFGIQVLDDDLVNDSANQSWQNDVVEIYLDGANNKASVTPKQISVNWNSKDWNPADEDYVSTEDGITTALKNFDGGYSIEVQVPWTAIGVTPVDKQVLGFDIVNNDNDGQVGNNVWIAWNGNGNNWASTAAYGSLVLNNADVEALPDVEDLGGQTIFTTQRAASSTNDFEPYELGTRFLATRAGQVTKVRIYTNDQEGGLHTVSIWDAGAQKVVSGPYDWDINEEAGQGAAGWKVFTLSTPLDIKANREYIVSVSTRVSNTSNDYLYSYTSGGLASTVRNGYLETRGGVYTDTMGTMPQSPSAANYFRDVVFVPSDGEVFTDDVEDMTKLYDSAFIYLLDSADEGGNPNFNAYFGEKSLRTWQDGAYLLYKAPEGSILSFSMETVETNQAPSAAFSVWASADGDNFSKVALNKTQIAVDQGWIYKNRYDSLSESELKDKQFIKITYNENMNLEQYGGVNKVSFNYLPTPNMPPVAAALQVNQMAAQGQALTGAVAASDPENDLLSYEITTEPQHGAVELGTGADSNVWTYTPAGDYVGYDSFVVGISDEAGGETATRVEVYVNYAPANLTYYVSDGDGSDSNNGLSAEAPFKTIQKASDVSKPGDTILIMNGTYGQTGGQGVVEITRSGLPGAYITYKAYPGHHPILKVEDAWNHIRVTGASFIKIEDLIIEGNQDDITQEQAQAVYDHMLATGGANDWGAVDWALVGSTNTNGIVIAGVDGRIVHHVELRNLDVSKCPGGGIGSSDADYIVFENNRVHDNSKWSIYANSGISMYEPEDYDNVTDTYKNIIRNNVSYNNVTTMKWYATQGMSDGNGIILDDFNNTQNGGKPYQGKTLVANNIVYNNGGSGIHAYESANVDIVNNTAYNNNRTDDLNWGQIFASSAANVNIINNILYARTGYRVNDNYNNTNVVYDYNVYFNGAPAVKGPHDIVADPKFADLANGDFRIGADSPAIDAGTSTLAPATDYAGTARPQGSGVDIGAYEYVVPTNHSGNQGTSAGDTTSTKSGLDVMVNGKSASIGQLGESDRNGQKVATVTLDAKKLKEALATAGEHAVIRIPVPSAFDAVIGQLNGQMASDLALQQASIDIRAAAGSYTLTAEQLGIQALAEQLGAGTDLEGIQVDIEIAAPSPDSVKLAEDAAAQGGFTLVIPPLSFTVKATYGGKTVELTRFDSYVERTIAIPDGVDPAKITTAVVVEADGSMRHVPTRIVQVDGRWAARINSVTNSLYALVGNSHSFADVAQHWAKDAVNEMGSRLIVSGVSADRFGPDQAISRAEFAAILVRGLGLKSDAGASAFTDIKGMEWYAGSVRAAYGFGLISGFEDGTFRPQETITREQAMVMIAKAMKLTGLTTGATLSASEQLDAFADAGSVASWAKDSVAASIEAGIVSGRSGTELAPKDAITRAEVAVIVQRLLQKSDLI